MTSRYWVRLFLNTLGIGALTSILSGFLLRGTELFGESGWTLVAVVSTAIFFAGVGFIFSIISQMGFFSYLAIHRFGLGIFRGKKLWAQVQIVLIAFVLFDLAYFRYVFFAADDQTIIPYLWIPILLLLIGAIVAYFKAKISGWDTFIPALFFMVVITTIEWLPVLRENDSNYFYMMIISLLFCNAYQLLTLQKLIQESETAKKIRSSKSPK